MHLNGIAALLTTYPLAAPRHGGQIRSSQIAEALRKRGLQVLTIAVADAGGYSRKDLSPNDIFFPTDSAFRLFDGVPVPYASDYLSGLYAAKDETAYQHILAAVPPRIDFLFLEQPWMLPTAQRLRTDRDIGCLVYSSQNDETALKRSMLERHHPEVAVALLEHISAQERKVCEEADLVFAVSESDIAALSRRCHKPIVLVPNGVEPRQAREQDIKRWQHVVTKDVARFGLYVASAHPPNFEGFFEVLGSRFGCMSPMEAIIVVGGASKHIERALSQREYAELCRSRLRFIGPVDAEDLAAIKQLAHAFVLPILQGSGSNLKTAEALYSRAWVVGTPVSFRGFERFRELPNVIIADAGKEFSNAIRQVMSCPAPVLSDEQSRMLEELTWDRTLAPMVDAISSRAQQ
jgi:glycosyltransferase involved in cell wall biosynthesis